MRQSKFSDLVDKVVITDFEDKKSIEPEVKSWLNEALIRVGREDLSCFERMIRFQAKKDQHGYDLDFVLPDYRKLISISSDKGPIHFQDIKRVDQRLYALDSSQLKRGVPEIAYIFEGTLYLYPVPREGMYISCRYYFIPEEMRYDQQYCPIPRERDYLLVKYARAQYDLREHNLEDYRQRASEFEVELQKWVLEDFEKCEDTSDMLTLERQYKEDWRRI